MKLKIYVSMSNQNRFCNKSFHNSNNSGVSGLLLVLVRHNNVTGIILPPASIEIIIRKIQTFVEPRVSGADLYFSFGGAKYEN